MKEKSKKMEIYKDKSASISLRVDDLLSKMTLKEKIGQCVQRPIMLHSFNSQFEKLMQFVENGECGSIILAFTAFAGEDPSTIVDLDVLNSIQNTAYIWQGHNSRLQNNLSDPSRSGRNVGL